MSMTIDRPSGKHQPKSCSPWGVRDFNPTSRGPASPSAPAEAVLFLVSCTPTSSRPRTDTVNFEEDLDPAILTVLCHPSITIIGGREISVFLFRRSRVDAPRGKGPVQSDDKQPLQVLPIRLAFFPFLGVHRGELSPPWEMPGGAEILSPSQRQPGIEATYDRPASTPSSATNQRESIRVGRGAR